MELLGVWWATCRPTVAISRRGLGGVLDSDSVDHDGNLALSKVLDLELVHLSELVHLHVSFD